MGEPTEEGGQRLNRYARIVERIFFRHYQPGATEVAFEREDLPIAAQELGITAPLNLGDIPYSFRYRQPLPDAILATAPEGKEWVIPAVGRARYQFVLRDALDMAPHKNWAVTKVPDATPGLVAMYSKGSDEQALLAKIRYNRLIDVFTGVTCYSLQNHLRTTVPDIGQVETDELYIGVDKRGAHYVFPVQAKGGRDRLGRVQIEQDIALCAHRFPGAICRPIAAQFMDANLIALFVFEHQDDDLRIAVERHYRLVPYEQLTAAELREYRSRSPTDDMV
jgi:hypothetical protein